ncbi:MAG: hypothetical protein ACOYON_15845 [Fimbriimonas sp.]
MPTIEELFDILPLNQAMPHLVPTEVSEHAPFVASIEASPLVKAGLWLYVDELEKAHVLVQDLDSAEACAWHAILHRREGDFSNSKYWWHRAGHYGSSEALAFVDLVADPHVADPFGLVEQQRREWLALFEICQALEAK